MALAVASSHHRESVFLKESPEEAQKLYDMAKGKSIQALAPVGLKLSLANRNTVASLHAEQFTNIRPVGAAYGPKLVQTVLEQKVSSKDTTNHEPEQEDAFFVADMGEIFRQHVRWKLNIGRVKAYYAVKCNPDHEVLRLLAALGTGFDCASIKEIDQVLRLGVEPERVIFAHPCKSRSSIRHAAKTGVKQMTFDNADELLKVKELFPMAELYLRLATDDSHSLSPLSTKFGASVDATEELLKCARDLKLNVVGVSFHVGSGSTDSRAYIKAVMDARTVFDQAKLFGYKLRTLDVGGGFMSHNFEDTAAVLRTALDEQFPSSVRVIGEPGRYFVTDAYTLACGIIARRKIFNSRNGITSYMLYLNDGVYGNFLGTWLERGKIVPNILCSKHGQTGPPVEYSIWGPTCDALDRIIPGSVFLSGLLDVGDWLYFKEMGAYSNCMTTSFNGFTDRHAVTYVCSEPAASVVLGY